MGAVDILLAALLALCVAAAAAHLIRRGGSCNGCCEGCRKRTEHCGEKK